jgi:uncharacterized membrane protein YfcA
MPQPKDKPASLILFELFCSCFFAIFLSATFGLIYGPMNVPLSVLLGFTGSFLLHSVFAKQINYAYWWIRVWWELKIKGDNS